MKDLIQSDLSDTPTQEVINTSYTRFDWENLIATIALRIRQSLDLHTILQTTADEVHQVLGCDRVLLYQFAPDWSGEVAVESVSDPQFSLLAKVVGDSCFDPAWIKSFDQGQISARADIDADPSLTLCHAEFLAEYQVRANLVCPISYQSHLWGFLIAHNCTEPRQWQLEEINGLQQIAVHVGVAIHQASLLEQLQSAKEALQDQLTTRTGELEQSNQDLEQSNQELENRVDAHNLLTTSLVEKQSFTRQVLDTLFSFMGVLDTDGILLESNQAPLEIAGLTRNDVIGKPFADAYWWAYSPEAPQQIREAIAQANQGEWVRFDIPIQTESGDLIIDFSLNPLRDETGKITHLISSGIDITDRKQIETTLRKSKDKLFQLAAIVESSQDAIISQTLDGIITSWNRAAERLFGYSALEMIDQFAADQPPIERQFEEDTILQRIYQGERIDTYETQRKHKDGRLIDIALTVSPIRDENGIVIGASKIARDISDRQQAELDIKSAKDQLELVLQASSEGFWDLNLLTGEIYFSPQWKAMMGYADHELENTLDIWVSMLLKEDQEEALKLFDEYKSANVDRYTSTQRYRHKNGSTVYVLSRAIHLKDEQGNVMRMIGIHLDMTQLVEMQNALKTSEMQLSGILSGSLDGISAFKAVRDQQGVIIDFEWLLINPTAYSILNRQGENLIGKRLLEELPGQRDEGIFDLYVQVVETGEPIQQQRHYKHDGIDDWFEIIAVKLGDGFSATFRNITVMKQSELAIQQVNQQLEERIADLNQRHVEMQALSEISDFLQACLTVEEACIALSQLVKTLFPNCAGGIFITCASRNRVELMSSWGESLQSEDAFLPNDCWALRRGRIHAVAHHRAGLRCKHVHVNNAIAATLCIPMIAQGETLGLFYLNSDNVAALTEDQQQLARTLAEQVSMAIANLRLQETLQQQSIRDPLTGLFNRRYLEDMLNKELSRAQRQQHQIAMIMIDIDHFKRFNDTFGHDAGDYVLQSVGTLLKKYVRSSDIACRYGGEEMILILPESTLEAASIRAEEIREEISQVSLSYNGQRLGGLTASFGVATYPQHGTTSDAVMQAADAALYRAKAAGRNQVLVAP